VNLRLFLENSMLFDVFTNKGRKREVQQLTSNADVIVIA
jgi:hypothetical protein